jgi:hypothetical protein
VSSTAAATRGAPTVHTAWNAGSEDVRGIIFIIPGDVEHEFVEV